METIKQQADTLLLVRPINFGFNPETAVNNAFQNRDASVEAQRQALREFDGFVDVLSQHGIDVLVVPDTPEPHTPDSIFPNNWFSTHVDGTLAFYPLFAANRRRERKQGVVDAIRARFDIRRTLDYTDYELEGLFLEGTGSLVFDRVNRVAYACASPRTDFRLAERCCGDLGVRLVFFQALDRHGVPIYHTNVMMAVADRYVVINVSSLTPSDRDRVLETIAQTDKAVVDISHRQMEHFAGNMLQVRNRDGRSFMVMSSQAHDSLSSTQIEAISAFDTIIHAPIPTIERLGGGSARCMLAEIFLPAGEPKQTVP